MENKNIIDLIKKIRENNHINQEDSEPIGENEELRINAKNKTVIVAEKDSFMPEHHRPYNYEWFLYLVVFDMPVEQVDEILDYNPKRQLFRFVENEKTPNAKNAIADMEKAKAEKIMKNGKPHSEVAQNYIRKLNRYKDYMIQDLTDDWQSEIENLILAAGNEDKFFLKKSLEGYEKAGELMKMLDTLNPAEWLDLIGFVFDLGYDMPLASWIVERYSPYATDFVEIVLDDKLLNAMPDVKDEYLKKKTIELEAEREAMEKEAAAKASRGPIILQFPGNPNYPKNKNENDLPNQPTIE